MFFSAWELFLIFAQSSKDEMNVELTSVSKNEKLVEALKNEKIPVDRIFIETDAPYLTPKDLKKKPFHNGPQFIPHISSRVANLLSIRRDELTTQILKNLRELFGEKFT